MASDTGKSALSPADIQRIVAAMQEHGANISVQDPRVSQLQTWLIGLVGVGIVGAALWIANTLNELKTAFEVQSSRQAVLYEQLERRVTKLEDRK